MVPKQLVFGLLVASVCAAGPHGPYEVSDKEYTVSSLDSTDRTVNVYWPSSRITGKGLQQSSQTSPPSRFPVVSYAHGWNGGTWDEPFQYGPLLTKLASFGYIVLAPQACNLGCKDNDRSLPLDPPGFRDFYEQQLLVLDWAKTMGDEVFSLANFSRVGIAGHSMGGQATLFSSSGTNASRHSITAAVCHHAFTHTFPTPAVPLLAFTGEKDVVAPPKMAVKIFQEAGRHSNLPRGLVNSLKATHLEPLFDNNENLALFTAAWMKMYVDQTPQADGYDFEALLFGDGAGSICGGADGKMANCTMIK